MTPRPLRLPRIACAALLGLAAACGSEQAAPAWPQGTVVAVDGEPILASEVDAHVEAMLDLENAFGLTQRRRMVLVNVSLPLAHARRHGGERRAEARRAAEEWLARLEAGEEVESNWQRLVGNWDQVGLTVWLAARELEPGAHSGVVELPGRFVVVRLEARDGAKNPALENVQVLLEDFPYTDRLATALQDYLEGELEIVDPAWNEIVPGALKYEMTGDATPDPKS